MIGFAIPLAERSWLTPGTSASDSEKLWPRVRSRASPEIEVVERMSVGVGALSRMTMVSLSRTVIASSTAAWAPVRTGRVRDSAL